MFSNLSHSEEDPFIYYPIFDSKLPFTDYIHRSRAIVQARRKDLSSNANKKTLIVEANSPFELYPVDPILSNNRLKYGVLLIHGLLDCPFSLKEIGHHLKQKGILCRAILLPGHGNHPEDLVHVSYHDWMQAVRYGVETLRQEVEQIFLVGYSTGAALSVYQALQDKYINGTILLSPAIRIRPPVDIVVNTHYLFKCISRKNVAWFTCENENDYAKYHYIPFNAVKQVSKLTLLLHELFQHRQLHSPLFMIMSQEDETISSKRAIDFFINQHNKESKILLYTAHDHDFQEARISTRKSYYPNLNIKNFSHVSIPFSTHNSHYGQHGDYEKASHNETRYLYGAYNRLEEKFYEKLFKLGLIKQERRELSYNPDFDFMANKIAEFILDKSPTVEQAIPHPHK